MYNRDGLVTSIFKRDDCHLINFAPSLKVIRYLWLYVIKLENNTTLSEKVIQTHDGIGLNLHMWDSKERFAKMSALRDLQFINGDLV